MCFNLSDHILEQVLAIAAYVLLGVPRGVIIDMCARIISCQDLKFLGFLTLTKA